MTPSLVPAALVVALVVAPWGGQEKPPPPQTFPGLLCSKCKTTGRIENPWWKDFARLEGGNTKFCSWALDRDPNGFALPWIPCRDCRNEAAKAAATAAFQPLAEERTKWLKERREVDQKIGTSLVHIQTPHFLVTFEIDHLTVGDRPYNQHEAAHLYADRLERLYKDFIDRYGETDADMHSDPGDTNFTLHWVQLYASQKTSMKAGPIYVGLQAVEGCKRVCRPSVFVTWWDKKKNPQENDLHRYIIHHTSHLLLGVMGKDLYVWLGQLNSGWLEEGLGHFYEIEWFKEARTHCEREGGVNNDWIFDDWHPWMRKHLAVNDSMDLASLDGKPCDTLTVKEHVFAWSFVEYLLKGEDPKKFPDFVKRLKQKEPLANAMRGVYGYNLQVFGEKWKDHVMKTYPMVVK